MSKCYIREATPFDAFALAPVLRVDDRNELSAVHAGEDPLMVLLYCMEVSDWTCAICSEEDGRVLGLCGVSPFLDYGGPWMLASDDLVEHQTTFLRHTKAIVSVMHRNYPVLANIVDARNKAHIKWLLWAGFQLGMDHPVDQNGFTFYPFFKRND
jgi:hypothetical protein